MSMIRWLLVRLRSYKGHPQRHAEGVAEAKRYEIMAQAHGDWLSFLATILEREQVIAGDELARALSEFASVTAVDRPEEGRILSFWAARLQDTAASLRDFPTIH